MAPLGFAAGLPVVLTSGTLFALMASQDVDLRVIGMFSLIGLPFALKFLWAPVLDYFRPPLLGRRRGWIIATQSLLVIALGVMGSIDMRHTAQLATAGFVVAFLSANHIAAIDAYRTDLLTAKERAAGAATYLLGFRTAGVFAGGVAVVMAARVSWGAVFWIFAALLALSMVATLIAPPLETRPRDAPASMRAAFVEPWRDYFRRQGALWALAVVLMYRVGESLAAPMIAPMLLSRGYDLIEIGALDKGVGFAASVVGTIAGGAILSRWYLRPALLSFGLLQAVANLGYAWLAHAATSRSALAVVVAVDNLAGGLAASVFIAWLMSLCSRSFSATQYALLYGVYAGAARLCGVASGYLVRALGWAAVFIVTAVAAIPGILLLLRLPPRVAMPEGENQAD